MTEEECEERLANLERELLVLSDKMGELTDELEERIAAMQRPMLADAEPA